MLILVGVIGDFSVPLSFLFWGTLGAVVLNRFIYPFAVHTCQRFACQQRTQHTVTEWRTTFALL
eukprot:4349267-Amphidinium_carterae.1